MSYVRAHEYNDDAAGVKYYLRVNSDIEQDWEIQVFDRNGNFKETLMPPTAFNHVPLKIRKMMRSDLARFQVNISADKANKA